jgi:hypothetical protein
MPTAHSDQPTEDSVYQRQASNRPIITTTSTMKPVMTSDPSDSVRQQDHRAEPGATTSTQAPSSVDMVLPGKEYVQREYYQIVAPSSHGRHASERTGNLTRPTPDLRLPPDSVDTNGPKPIALHSGKEEHSPPLTGKDSAYSSVSGGSLTSPTAAHPRSASAQSSYAPRAHFGLFPSSSPSTPKQSISGRHGAMSPAFSSSQSQQAAYLPAPRAQTSLDNYNTPSSRRLLKKSSLSSLKRLFSKKRHGGIEAIVE